MNIYKSIETAIRLHEETLYVNDTIHESDVRYAIRWVMRDNPDIFWFVHQYHFDQEKKIISFRYRASKERVDFIQRSIDDVIEKDFQVDHVRLLGVYEQVMYVYKWLLEYCNYNTNSAYNQCIDSVFMRRNSVCTGYAKAAQYLFNLLGIKSRLVFGRLNNDKEDGRHCWNIVYINGQSYHLDVCLGDASLEYMLKELGITGILHYGDFNYNYFCVSTSEIEKTRTIEDIDTLPVCDKCLNAENVKRLSNINVRMRTETVGCLLTHFGSSADIFLCSKDKNVVLKKFKDGDNRKCAEEFGYMNLLKECKHLLHLNTAYSDETKSIIAIEQSIPIVDLFCSHYYHPTLRDILIMMRDVTIGWIECYNSGILYCDIHVCNIYKSNDGIYKLGDFGSCIYEFVGLNERVGNLWFMSPETYFNGVFNECSAVYSIASVLYFILNGLCPPFVNDSNEKDALQMKMSGDMLPIPLLLHSFPKKLSEKINRFLIQSCAYHPLNRIRTPQHLLIEISTLLKDIEGSNILLQFVHKNSESILNHNPQNIDIPRHIYYKFAYGERVERMATTAHNVITDMDDYGSMIENFGGTDEMEFHDADVSSPISDDMENFGTSSSTMRVPHRSSISEDEMKLKREELKKKLLQGRKITLKNNGACQDSSFPNITIPKAYCAGGTDEMVFHDADVSSPISDDVENYCVSMAVSSPTPKNMLGKEEKITFSPSPSYRITNEPESEVTYSSAEKPVTGSVIGKVVGDIREFFMGGFDAVAALIKAVAKASENDDQTHNPSSLFDEVFGSVFAPAEVKRKSHLLVQVYLHLYEETEKVKMLAQESQKDVERRDYIPLQCNLKKGDKVDVQLSIFGETLLMSEKKSVVWRGSFTKCSFDYFVSKDIDIDELSCMALLTVNNIPVGELGFTTNIVDFPNNLNPKVIAHKYNKVFISYAHQDESKVKFLAEGFKVMNTDYFFDRHYLKTGDVFPQKIQDYINFADLFILCWSENASKSEYVEKERVQALERAFPKVKPAKAAKLSIYPMSIEPRTELPCDMRDNYHFGEI